MCGKQKFWGPGVPSYDALVASRDHVLNTVARVWEVEAELKRAGAKYLPTVICSDGLSAAMRVLSEEFDGVIGRWEIGYDQKCDFLVLYAVGVT